MTQRPRAAEDGSRVGSPQVSQPVPSCAAPPSPPPMEAEKPFKSLRSPWQQAAITVIAATRRQANLTQEDLARCLGWRRSRIAKIERDARRLDLPEFIAIALALRVEPVVLLGRVLDWVK